jgi:hypothetical protein
VGVCRFASGAGSPDAGFGVAKIPGVVEGQEPVGG